MITDSHFLYVEAKRIIERQLGFWIHFAFFLGVNFVLAVLNWFTHPQFLWFLYPLISWGLALYFHFLFSMVFHEQNLQKWKRLLRSKRKAEALVLFWVHAASYLGVSFFLVAIDLLSGDRSFWAIWPILGWGIGLLVHGLCVWIFTEKYFKQIAAKIHSQDLIEARVYLRVHVVTYILTNISLFLMSFFFFHQYEFILWMALGWGIGLGCHWLWLVANRGHRIKKWKQKQALKLMQQLQENPSKHNI